MATSSTRRARRRPAAMFIDQGVALAWGAWAELGVSGWTTTHQAWAVDPEPLIVFTAFLEDADPRLRDEATDWCIRNWRHVSKTRLKNLVNEQPPEVRDAFGVFSATVSSHAGITWPHRTEPRRYTVTGRSVSPQLEKPSMIWLRMRATFGLGARTEILRYFLAPDAQRASVAAIAETISYTKRNVADECESLAEAGMLTVRPVRNRYLYSLAKRNELESLVGPLPGIRPNYSAIFNVARELIKLEQQASSATIRTLPVKARKTLDRIELDLDELAIDPPTATGSEIWPALKVLGTQTLGVWSLGLWHDDDHGEKQVS